MGVNELLIKLLTLLKGFNTNVDSPDEAVSPRVDTPDEVRFSRADADDEVRSPTADATSLITEDDDPGSLGSVTEPRLMGKY